MHHWSQRRRLATVLALNLALIAALVVVGLLSHSLGVLAAAGDNAADSVGLALGLLAVTVRDRAGGDPARSRATTVVALLNGTMLTVVFCLVLWESVQRLREGTPEVLGAPMMAVSVVSMLAMLVGAWVLGTGAGREDLHMRSVLLDTLADAAAAGAVAVAGLVIWLTGGNFWLDPVLAIVISLVVIVAAVHLLHAGIRLLRGEDVDLDDD